MYRGSLRQVLCVVVIEGWSMSLFLVVCLRGVDAVTRRVGAVVIE